MMNQINTGTGGSTENRHVKMPLLLALIAVFAIAAISYTNRLDNESIWRKSVESNQEVQGVIKEIRAEQSNFEEIKRRIKEVRDDQKNFEEIKQEIRKLQQAHDDK